LRHHTALQNRDLFLLQNRKVPKKKTPTIMLDAFRGRLTPFVAKRPLFKEIIPYGTAAKPHLV
jgi:hypothetical protein